MGNCLLGSTFPSAQCEDLSAILLPSSLSCSLNLSFQAQKQTQRLSVSPWTPRLIDRSLTLTSRALPAALTVQCLV